MNPRVLIIGGAGLAGSTITRLLLEATKEVEVCIGSRNRDQCRKVAETFTAEFEPRRITYTRVDVASTESLEKAFSGSDIVVNASPTVQYTRNIVAAYLKGRADYLDIQLSSPVKWDVLREFEDQIASRPRCFITDGGLHPGLAATVLRHGLDQLDEPETAHAFAAFDIDWKGMGESAETGEEFIDEFKWYNSRVFRDGSWIRPSWRTFPSFEFRSPIGQKKCAPMFMEEMGALPDRYPSLKNAGFYVAGFNAFVDNVIFPVVFAGVRLFPKRRHVLLSKLLKWGLSRNKPPYGLELTGVCHGFKHGTRATRITSITHTDGYLATAAPAVSAILQLIQDGGTRSGLWLQATYTDVNTTLNHLRQFGLHVTHE